MVEGGRYSSNFTWPYGIAGNIVVPYVPTNKHVINTVLEAMELREGDVLYDLGCGDGRILIEAAKRYPIKKGVGIEAREHLIKEAIAKAKEAGVYDKLVFIHGDFFQEDISEATVVYMYLLTSVNERLKPKLERELRPGTRVVTLDFSIPGWKPVRVLGDGAGWQRTIYVYVIGKSNV
ncbi:class I SAM-dependent methyltransferase [Stetteria hydrogenophila]